MTPFQQEIAGGLKTYNVECVVLTRQLVISLPVQRPLRSFHSPLSGGQRVIEQLAIDVGGRRALLQEFDFPDLTRERMDKRASWQEKWEMRTSPSWDQVRTMGTFHYQGYGDPRCSQSGKSADSGCICAFWP